MTETNPTPDVQIFPIQNWPYWVAFTVTAPSGTKMRAVQNFISLNEEGGSYNANAQFRTEICEYAFWLYIGEAAAKANDAGKPLYAGVQGVFGDGNVSFSTVVTLPGNAWGNTTEQAATGNPPGETNEET